jgi:Zn-dependent protease
MIVAIGFIFSRFIRREHIQNYDPMTVFLKPSIIEDIKRGALIAAPAIVFHELAHKFVAMGFGATAILHAPIFWYAIVIVMMLFNFPLLFFVGGYVSHSPLPAWPSFLVSISGIAVNLLMYFGFRFVVKNNLVNKKYHNILIISSKLNLFLAGFNLIPLPGFDGYNALRSLFGLF